MTAFDSGRRNLLKGGTIAAMTAGTAGAAFGQERVTAETVQCAEAYYKRRICDSVESGIFPHVTDSV